jgi:hypothetical protein
MILIDDRAVGHPWELYIKMLASIMAMPFPHVRSQYDCNSHICNLAKGTKTGPTPTHGEGVVTVENVDGVVVAELNDSPGVGVTNTVVRGTAAGTSTLLIT